MMLKVGDMIFLLLCAAAVTMMVFFFMGCTPRY